MTRTVGTSRAISRSTHDAAVFVDDRPEDLAPGLDVLSVSPYLSEDPHDHGYARCRSGPGCLTEGPIEGTVLMPGNLTPPPPGDMIATANPFAIPIETEARGKPCPVH